MKLWNYGSAKLLLYQLFRNMVLVLVLTPRLRLLLGLFLTSPLRTRVQWLASKSIVSQNSNVVAKFCFSVLTISGNS